MHRHSTSLSQHEFGRVQQWQTSVSSNAAHQQDPSMPIEPLPTSVDDVVNGATATSFDRYDAANLDQFFFHNYGVLPYISPTEGVSAAASAPPYDPAGSNHDPSQHPSKSGALDSTFVGGAHSGTRLRDPSEHIEDLQSAYDVFGQPQTRDTLAVQASPDIRTTTLGQDAHARWHSNASSIWSTNDNHHRYEFVDPLSLYNAQRATNATEIASTYLDQTLASGLAPTGSSGNGIDSYDILQTASSVHPTNALIAPRYAPTKNSAQTTGTAHAFEATLLQPIPEVTFPMAALEISREPSQSSSTGTSVQTPSCHCCHGTRCLCTDAMNGAALALPNFLPASLFNKDCEPSPNFRMFNQAPQDVKQSESAAPTRTMRTRRNSSYISGRETRRSQAAPYLHPSSVPNTPRKRRAVSPAVSVRPASTDTEDTLDESGEEDEGGRYDPGGDFENEDSPADSDYHLDMAPPSRYKSSSMTAVRSMPGTVLDITAESRIRSQKVRSEEDKYTPRWVRGTAQQKEGLCDLCEPGKWLQLKNSAFWYHKQFTHGISSVTGRPFASPESIRINHNQGHEEGLCHECQTWITYRTKRSGTHSAIDHRIPGLWYKHAHKCHHRKHKIP